MKNSIISIINNDEGLYEGNLRYYYKVVFNAPNANNPYHNFRHMMHVLCQTYEGAVYCEYLTITNKRKFRALLIAAMFHDYGHSDRMDDDKAEIMTALKGFEENILEEDRNLSAEVKALILFTEFPHANTVVTIGAEILRDADMSQLFADAWMQQIVFGIAQEMNITPMQALKNQIIFLQEMRFYSEWGKRIFYPQVHEKLQETRALLSLLENN